MSDSAVNNRRSYLYDRHLELGATMASVGGWDVPEFYSSEAEEHEAVRSTVGIFDLTQMGEIRVSGPDAPSFLAHSLISAMKPIALGKAKYTMIVQEDGGIIDDLIAYRLGVDEYMLVQNAGNLDDVFAVLEERVGGYDVEITDHSIETALLAVQGPKAKKLISRLVPEEARQTVKDLRYYSCTSLEVAGVEAIVARTGYTGEDGFELFVPSEKAEPVWNALLEEGADLGVRPCGIACRDTLRLEAAMPLYGKELTRSRTPLEAGYHSLISPAKGRFIGRNALINQPEPTQVLVGLSISGKKVPAEGAELHDASGNYAGTITSAVLSPTLKQVIAFAYVDRWNCSRGTEFSVDVDGDSKTAKIVPTPFYNRKKR